MQYTFFNPNRSFDGKTTGDVYLVRCESVVGRVGPAADGPIKKLVSSQINPFKNSMKLFKTLTFISALLYFSATKSFAVQGCLSGNDFFTSYLGFVRSSNASFSGDVRVYNLSGTITVINYSGTNSCGAITAPGGSISRNGPLCFVLPQATYNSYPVVSGTGGTVRSAASYPNKNGTLENLTPYTTPSCPVPLDDHVPLFILLVGGCAAFKLKKRITSSIV